MFDFRPSSRVIIVCGHFGAGKTNVSVNLALHLKKTREKVTLIDADIVNPYFRSADNGDLLRENGIRCIFPPFANSNVDIPCLPADIYSVFESDETVLIDVGGDDRGATMLASFSDRFEKTGWQMLYVFNRYRPLTSTPEEAVAIMREIEAACGMRCTDLVNNSNLGEETTPEIIRDSIPFANTVREMTSLPLLFTSVCPGYGEDRPDLMEIRDVTHHLIH